MDICARFITDGIHDAMAHYRRDELPLHRLTWELRSRIDALVPHAPAVWINQLRDLQHRVAEFHARNGHVELIEDLADDQNLDASLQQLTEILTLDTNH